MFADERAMIHLLYFASLIGLVSSTVFLGLAIVAGWFYHRGRKRETLIVSQFPPVSVLKPLHGMEPRLEQNLESFFLQDYPDFEIVFGARHETDPALRVVESLQRKYPKIRTRVVLSGEPTWPNAKVFALGKMLDLASAGYVVITDSDVCVDTDCLKAVVRPLLDPGVGVVTCLYRGIPAGGFWSTVEALGMSIEMPSGVLVARMLEDMKFALGPTMATRKDVLTAIGGIAVLGEYCADDYVLGNAAHEAGKKVILSEHIIGHVAMNTSCRASVAHQVRWMRSTRFSRRAGHIGTGLTYAMPFGLLGAIAGGLDGKWQVAAALMSWAYINRVIQSVSIGWGVIGDAQSLRYCWLYPIRDLMGFLVWCASFVGNEIVWRNERYRLVAGGKMLIQRGANERT
jgi:ceramide glucosyltransferase